VQSAASAGTGGEIEHAFCRIGRRCISAFRTAKTPRSERDIDLCPTVRRLFASLAGRNGSLFSFGGCTPVGEGSWIKRRCAFR